MKVEARTSLTSFWRLSRREWTVGEEEVSADSEPVETWVAVKVKVKVNVKRWTCLPSREPVETESDGTRASDGADRC